MPVLAGEQQPRPGRPALVVVGPLHLVEDEHLALERRHLDRRARDRRALVDALLAGDEGDPLLPHARGEPPMRLLGEHAQRPRVDAAALLGEERQCVVRLAGVRGAEMRDDGLGLRAARGKRQAEPLLTLGS